MTSKDSQHILNGFASLFPSIAFLNYEMITPEDKFGQQMVENIEMRGCSLLGLSDCPSTDAQISRMQSVLTATSVEDAQIKVESLTMFKIYQDKLNTEGERTRIEKLEMFDEWEEWNLLQMHYCLTLATRATPTHPDLSSI